MHDPFVSKSIKCEVCGAELRMSRDGHMYRVMKPDGMHVRCCKLCEMRLGRGLNGRGSHR